MLVEGFRRAGGEVIVRSILSFPLRCICSGCDVQPYAPCAQIVLGFAWCCLVNPLGDCMVCQCDELSFPCLTRLKGCGIPGRWRQTLEAKPQIERFAAASMREAGDMHCTARNRIWQWPTNQPIVQCRSTVGKMKVEGVL